MLNKRRKLQTSTYLILLIFGFGGSIMVYFIFNVVFAIIFTDYIKQMFTKSGSNILIFIFVSLYLISVGIPIIISFLINTIDKEVVLTNWIISSTSLMSFVTTLGIMFIISNGVMFFTETQIFVNLSITDFFLNYPKVLLYFGVFKLNGLIFLFIINILLYNLFYVFYIRLFY